MDPNLFRLDWERTFEVLAGIIVLAFLLERALSVVFENRLILPRIEGRGIKEFITLGVAIALCRYLDFDALSMIILRNETGWTGEVLTGAVIAGGSKASVKLFRDLWEVRSTAYSEYERFRDEGLSTRAAAERVAAGTAPPPPDSAPPKPGA